MKKIIAANFALIALFAFTAMFFIQTHADARADEAAFEKLDYGDDLYGLPNLIKVHKERTWDKLDYGDDLYGLPMIGKFHKKAAKLAWDKLDYGDDLYGLPNIG